MNWTAIIVFVLLFGSVTVLGFVAAHWRRGDLDLLHEWGLAGRRHAAQQNSCLFDHSSANKVKVAESNDILSLARW